MIHAMFSVTLSGLLRRPLRLAGCWLLAYALAPSLALGQFSQYVTPGTLDETPQRIGPLLKEAMAASPWRAGRLHLSPAFELRELAYDSNVGNRQSEPKVSDVTATVAVGLRSYLPFGSDLVFAMHALPEYVAWNRLDERNDVNGRYGLGVFGPLGPLDLHASVTRVDDDRFLSRELEDRIDSREIGADLALDFHFPKGFELFTLSSLREIDYVRSEENTSLTRLNREDTSIRLGLRRQLTGGVVLSLGVEDREADFDNPGALATSSGTSPFGELRYQGKRLTLSTELVAQTLDFDNAPDFEYDTLLGRFSSVWSPLPFLEFQLYGNRNLVYALDSQWTFFEDQNLGFGLVSSLGSRAVARLFVESGDNDYTSLGNNPLLRSDDFDVLGGDLLLKLGRVTVELAISETEFDSNIESFDRTVNNITINLVFGERFKSPWG